MVAGTDPAQTKLLLKGRVEPRSIDRNYLCSLEFINAVIMDHLSYRCLRDLEPLRGDCRSGNWSASKAD
jgi:hypothetical protein